MGQATIGAAFNGVNSAARPFGVANTPDPEVDPETGIVRCGATSDGASREAPTPVAASTPAAITAVIIVRLTDDIVRSFLTSMVS